MNRARELYAATFGPAPNMRPWIEQAEQEALRDKVENLDDE